MAGLNEIRARLADAKSDVEESLDRRRRRARPQLPPPAARPAGANDVALDAERKQRSELQQELAEAWAELARSRGELAGTRSRLERELERAEEQLKEARATAAPRSQPGSGNEKSRITELEDRLTAERERREDLELALDLLQKQHTADARRMEELEGRALASASRPPPAPGALPAAKPQPANNRPVEARPEQPAPGLLPAAKPQSVNDRPVEAKPELHPPEQPTTEPEEDPADGWGVSLDAFPVVEDESGTGRQKGASADTGGSGPRSVFRRRARRDRG